MAKYLDEKGLGIYDSLIKDHINSKIKEVNDTAVSAVKGVKVGNASVVGADHIANIPESAKKTLGVVDLDKFKLTEGAGGKLVIKYGDGIELTSTITYSDLVKDGILEEVDLITVPTGNAADTDDNENAPGTYLKFTFNTDAGRKKPIYVNVTSLIDEYAWQTGAAFEGKGSYITVGAKVTGSGKKSDTYKLELTVDESKLDNKLNELVLKPATSSELGGIKIGYTVNGKNYPVVLDKDNKAYVNVPWTDTDTNTHYTTHLYAGSGTAANATTTNGKTNLTITDDSTVRNSIAIKGTGATTVSSDNDGNITINSTDTDTHYTTRLYAGSGTAANITTTNGNTKLTITDNSTIRDSIAIKGTGATTVSSDDAGNITIDSPVIEALSRTEIESAFSGNK